jgi:hypothetical protein
MLDRTKILPQYQHLTDEEINSYPVNRIRRITGYLVGDLSRFNNAKLAEVNDRVKHGGAKPEVPPPPKSISVIAEDYDEWKV